MQHVLDGPSSECLLLHMYMVISHSVGLNLDILRRASPWNDVFLASLAVGSCLLTSLVEGDVSLGTPIDIVVMPLKKKGEHARMTNVII